MVTWTVILKRSFEFFGILNFEPLSLWTFEPYKNCGPLSLWTFEPYKTSLRILYSWQLDTSQWEFYEVTATRKFKEVMANIYCPLLAFIKGKLHFFQVWRVFRRTWSEVAKHFARQKHKKYEEPLSSKCSIFEPTNMTGCCKDVIY